MYDLQHVRPHNALVSLNSFGEHSSSVTFSLNSIAGILFTCHFALNSHFLCFKATPSQSSAQVVLQQVKRL
jgi:hypothetical protein